MINPELKTRLLALAWRAGGMAVIAILATISEALPDLGLPELAVVMLGLVINEVTKTLNKKYELGKKMKGMIVK